MVNTQKIFIGVLTIAVGAALVIWLIPDEKKAIRKQFARMSDLVRKDANESLFATAGQAKAISELLTDPCEFKGNLHSLGGTYTRQEAAMAIAGIRTQLDTMTLDFADLTMEFPAKDKAHVTLTARVNGKGSGEAVTESRELDCSLLKVDGKWLFNTCQTVEVFQK